MESVKRTQRTYRSPLREEAARRTREAVVEAAAEVFVDEGYAGATIEQIRPRGVSRPTVFGVGSKAQLFALARQRAATAVASPPTTKASRRLLAIPDARRLLEGFAAFTAAISQRLGPLQLVLEQAAGTDPELAQLLESSQQELLECARPIVAAVAATGSLRRDIPAEAAADMLWLQIQPTNYRRLVRERGWSHRAFERWHAAAMIAALLEPSGPADPETRTAKTSALLAAPVQPAGHREGVAAVGGAEFSRRPLQLTADDPQFVAGEAVPGPPERDRPGDHRPDGGGRGHRDLPGVHLGMQGGDARLAQQSLAQPGRRETGQVTEVGQQLRRDMALQHLGRAAEALAADHDPAEALIAWLRLINARAAVNNGLAAAMAASEDSGTPGSLQSCHAMIAAAGGALLQRAIGSGAVRPDVGIHDLLGLVNALARADGGHDRTSEDENRLLMLALTGIMTRPAD